MSDHVDHLMSPDLLPACDSDQPCPCGIFHLNPPGLVNCPACLNATPIHKQGAELEGSSYSWHLPLCWEADARHRFGADYDHDDWWTSVDHGAIEPHALATTVANAAVTCRECVAWMRA